jgi:hypothetical protein
MEMHGAPSEGRVAFSYDGEIIQKTNLGFEDRLSEVNPYDPMS